MVSFENTPRKEQPTPVEGTPAVTKTVAPTVESASKLGEDLITRWVADGGTPLVSADRRDEVVATLNRCMACDAVRAAYVGSLEAGWRAHRHRPPMAGYPAGDIAEEVITRHGFGALDEVSLGDMAHCPAAIRAMHHALNYPPSHPDEILEAGDWFFNEWDVVGRR